MHNNSICRILAIVRCYFLVSIFGSISRNLCKFEQNVTKSWETYEHNSHADQVVQYRAFHFPYFAHIDSKRYRTATVRTHIDDKWMDPTSNTNKYKI